MIPEETSPTATRVPRFAERILAASPSAETPERIATLMLNVGLRCEASCAHCHHACTPERIEVMSHDTMLAAVRLAETIRPDLVDITGGEPEVFAQLPELIERLAVAGIATRVRTNLVALARPEHAGLAELFAARGVRVLASLPGTSAAGIEAQRGSAWWKSALTVLRHLAHLGYGLGPRASDPETGGTDEPQTRLVLELACNPAPGALSRPQSRLETEFREALEPLGVTFDSLLAINNVPVGRLRTRMEAAGTYAEYLELLAAQFNSDVVEALGCRHGIEIAWDGSIWDCDFNLAARTRPGAGPRALGDVLGESDPEAALARRRIGFGPHCFACTAAAGSS